LKERRNQLAGTLSGGEQQMCAIGRALMANPKLLLIDELSLGLAPVIVDRLIEIVDRIRKEKKTTIFLVEQDVEVALGIADKGYIIETGKITKSGPAKELLEDSYIKTAYLGI
ncbi:MAG TPA: ATP-binding cassette domain-containing protein, partial [Candidatus Atribacteria bacterium]|nr:ATP-binding cassette domain-containing protein [Candidatus Atribacteria bacterium]